MDNTVNTENESDETNTVVPEEAIVEKHSEVTIITEDDFPENIEVYLHRILKLLANHKYQTLMIVLFQVDRLSERSANAPSYFSPEKNSIDPRDCAKELPTIEIE